MKLDKEKGDASLKIADKNENKGKWRAAGKPATRQGAKTKKKKRPTDSRRKASEGAGSETKEPKLIKDRETGAKFKVDFN